MFENITFKNDYKCLLTLIDYWNRVVYWRFLRGIYYNKNDIFKLLKSVALKIFVFSFLAIVHRVKQQQD